MANEVLYRADVICQLLGEGERFSDQTRYLKSQGTVKPLDMIGYPPLLFDDSMLLLWNHTLIRTKAICIEGRMLPVAFWY